MKKLIPFFLLFCLLFTGCAGSLSSDTALSTEATSEPISPSESSTEQLDIPTTQTTTIETPPTELQETTAHPNTSGVKMDFSYYYNSPVTAPKFTRLSENPLTDLQPTRSGLQIYPYAGRKCSFSHSYDAEGNPIYSYIYGIVDETGCILVDPVYKDVFPLINEATEEFLPIWVLRKEHNTTEGNIGFAAMDGSFVINCIYDGVYANDGRVIAFHPQEQWNGPIAFDVYDFSGQLLFTSKDLDLEKQLIGPSTNYTYGEGLYTVSFENSDEEIYYINEDGQQVLGPYYSASAFTGGMAAVSPTYDSTVYIDKTGTVLPIPYISRQIYPDGVYSVWEDTTPESDVYGQTTQITWYSPSGEVLWVRDNCSTMGPHLAFYDSYRHGRSYLENLKTSQTYILSSDAVCNSLGNPLDPVIIVCYYDDQLHAYCTRYMTDNFEDIGLEMSDYHLSEMYEIGSFSQACAVITDKGTATVYIEGSSPYASYPVGSFTHFEGYPGKVGAFTTEHYTRLYTSEGELFFSYPVSTMDD